MGGISSLLSKKLGRGEKLDKVDSDLIVEVANNVSEKRVAPSDVSKHFQINRPPDVPEEENFEDTIKDLWLHGHDGDYVVGGKKMGMVLLPLIGMHQRDETQVNNRLKGLTKKGILPKKDKEVTRRGDIDIYTYRYN